MNTVKHPNNSIGRILRQAYIDKGSLLEKNDIIMAAAKADIDYITAIHAWVIMVSRNILPGDNHLKRQQQQLWFQGMAFAVLINSGVATEEIGKGARMSPELVDNLAKIYMTPNT